MLAVITGASSGLGTAFARKLAARGYDLMLIARRQDRLQALARELGEQYHVNVEAVGADLTVEGALSRVAGRISTAADLGLLVNNAGFGTLGYFFEADVDSQEQMHRLHVLATVRLSHAALANMVARGLPGTGVINVSSVAAYAPSPGNASYCSTKAWMNRFTEALSMDLEARSSPVSVQALCPGFVLTEFHDTLRMDRSTIPSAWWMSADFVVEESLRGFAKRTLFVIPSLRYKLVVAFMKITPGFLLRRGTMGLAGRYRRQKPA
jgi:short-subunit dehydrogenase